ncbi:MAG: hypothetical protein U0842_07360 [Candidatus Binatia bacterium]
MERPTRRFTLGASLLAALALATLASSAMAALAAIPTDFPDPAGRKLPQPLQRRLTDLGKRPHTYRPLTIFSEAPTPSRLFGYYLLDGGGFQPNVFTAVIPDLNSGVVPTATGANGDLPPIGSVRLALEPKPGLPTDPNDVESFIDVFTDISGLFVINNESGWYEGWMIHDVVIPDVAPPRADGHAMFGAITADDATALAALGAHDVPGAVFTRDGEDVRPTAASDHFPDVQTNVVPLQLSMGAYNCLQQSDCHSYWEFNEYTDWVSPLYELGFTGGIPGTFEAGQIAELTSAVPGSGPSGVAGSPVAVGDDPDDPRDPDRGQASSLTDADRPQAPNDEHKEKRLRFVPSGLGNEVLLDAYVRLASYEPGVTDVRQRIFDAYRDEVARIDENGDGIVSFEEADAEDTSDGGQSNERLYLPATAFDRFAVTREIDDGLLAPRFAPSQRAWLVSGQFVLVSPPVNASVPQDADNR